MKKFPGRALALAAACAATPWVCHAGDGTITINGVVTTETCTIASPSFTVNLPKVSTSTLSSAGATAGRTQFSIALSNCIGLPASSSVYAFFEAGATTNAAGRLIASGGATNVDIELLSQVSGSLVPINIGMSTQGSALFSVVSNAATLTYYAQYRATGAAGAGTANTSVTYTIVYP